MSGGEFKQAWALYETTVYVYILSNCSSAVYSVYSFMSGTFPISYCNCTLFFLNIPMLPPTTLPILQLLHFVDFVW